MYRLDTVSTQIVALCMRRWFLRFIPLRSPSHHISRVVRGVELSESWEGRGQCGYSQGWSRIDRYLLSSAYFNSLDSTSHFGPVQLFLDYLHAPGGSMGGRGRLQLEGKRFGVITKQRGKKDRKMGFILEHIFLSTKNCWGGVAPNM